jgi:hypothetical protein
VAFLDDDDLYLPHKLSVQVPVLENQPRVGVVYGQNLAFLCEDFISFNTILVHREALQRVGYFDESLPTMEHCDMFLRIAAHVYYAFIPGNVTIQRYSGQGTWTESVLDGAYEQTHANIVERVLAMLPDTAEYAPVKRKARASLFFEIANNLTSVARRGWIGFDRVRAHVLTGLRSSPWIVTELLVRASLVRSARCLARTSASPIAAVCGFSVELCAAVGSSGLRGRW